jgi:hypothetical protein
MQRAAVCSRERRLERVVGCGDNGVQVQMRTCTNPPPKYGGAPCYGNDFNATACGHRELCTSGAASAKTEMMAVMVTFGAMLTAAAAIIF